MEEKATLEEAFMTDAEVSIETPNEQIQDLPPSPTTQAELVMSPFRKAFEHSQCVEMNGPIDVGYFSPVDKDNVPEGGYIFA